MSPSFICHLAFHSTLIEAYIGAENIKKNQASFPLKFM